MPNRAGESSRVIAGFRLRTAEFPAVYAYFPQPEMGLHRVLIEFSGQKMPVHQVISEFPFANLPRHRVMPERALPNLGVHRVKVSCDEWFTPKTPEKRCPWWGNCAPDARKADRKGRREVVCRRLRRHPLRDERFYGLRQVRAEFFQQYAAIILR